MHESAPDAVWLAVLADYPDMASWVAHNKSIPSSIIERLAEHSEPAGGASVASSSAGSGQHAVPGQGNPDGADDHPCFRSRAGHESRILPQPRRPREWGAENA